MKTIHYEKNSRLEKQLQFILEIDKLKTILRKSLIFAGDRYENDAEHSWTICVMALLLEEYADFPVDIKRVIAMLLIHDVVEVDAGDTFLYSEQRADVEAIERKAAERIFGLLEDDQKEYFLALWNEYDEGRTNEAKFAAVFDRLEPLMQNFFHEGYTWKQYSITYEMVVRKNRHIQDASEELWGFVQYMLDLSVERGYLVKEKIN